MNKNIDAEQILNNIFEIMNQLYDEMRLMKNSANNHLKVFEILADLGKTLATADRASFWKWNKKDHKLVTAAATGTEQIVIDDTTGLVGKALAENRAIVTNDPYNHPNFNSEVDNKTGYVTKSILVMPVSNCFGEVIGVFQVINKLGDVGFDEVKDTKRLAIAAFICGMALESDLFLADSQRDKLTDLKNRLGFQYDYQTRYKNFNLKPMSIIMCDIDFFKKVNDTYGHDGGDTILKVVSKILSEEISKTGCAYRWGGEEFLIILENVNLAKAVRIAEKIRQRVENSVCDFDNQKISVTMSFGCSECSPDISFEENIQQTDKFLYTAKNTGRNKVVSKNK